MENTINREMKGIGCAIFYTDKGRFYIEPQGKTVSLHDDDGKCIQVEAIDFTLNGDINSAWDKLIETIKQQ